MGSEDVYKRQIFMGAQGIQKNWKMRADRKSAAYTTKLLDIPEVS